MYKKVTFHLHAFIFVFIYPVFHWGNIIKKVLWKVGGWEKIFKGHNGHIGGFVYRKGKFKPTSCYEKIVQM